MAIIDLHSKEFDEATITKLELFEDYAKEWIPTFVMSNCTNLWIFDYFAGPGYDKNNVEGSPIRILRQVAAQIGNIFRKQTKINICFNEYDEGKFNLLQQHCNQFIDSHPELQRAVNCNLLNIKYRNCDFATLFPKTLLVIRNNPSLLYLDQNGLKFLADSYLLELEKTNTTDFLYYASSSYLLRFGNTPEFQSLKLDISKIKKQPAKYVHRELLYQLKEKLPKETNLSLYPFTIKKGANYYGIVFGASHPRAVDKFLKTSWKRNETNGAANFDIDDDGSKSQLDIFRGKSLTKIEQFQQNLRDKILSGEITNNRETFDYVLSQGHISNHATKVVRELKQAKMITYDKKQPYISYEQTYGHNKQIVKYTIIRK